MISEISTFVENHKGMATIAAAWLVREIPVVWPRLVSIYPYARANGGVFGIAKHFFFGTPATPAEPKPSENPK